jgi:hypothetical protein
MSRERFMKRRYIEVGEEAAGDMLSGGSSTKYLIVTMRNDGSISIRPKHESSSGSDGWGCYFPKGTTKLRTVKKIHTACETALSEVSWDVGYTELEEEIRKLGKEWNSSILHSYADFLENGDF